MLRAPVGFGNQVLEIVSAEGRNAAFFTVIDAHAGAVPDKPQLVFRKYGDDYFPWKVFDAGSDLGVEVAESQYEKV